MCVCVCGCVGGGRGKILHWVAVKQDLMGIELRCIAHFEAQGASMYTEVKGRLLRGSQR